MKAFSKTTLFLLIAMLAFASCKSDKSKSYRAYYQTINREYAKIRAAQAQAEMGDSELDMEDPARDEIARLERDLSDAQAQAQAYREAFERAFPQPQAAPQGREYIPPVEPKDLPPKPKIEIPFREYSVTATNGYEHKLKKFNVVVATLSREAGVERLKKAFASSGTQEDVVIVKNEQGLFNFVIGSYNTREEAILKREQVLTSYYGSFSHKDLMNKYGIPFSDTWILINK